MGLPGMTGIEHIGITVPNLEEATRFLVDVLGCEPVFEVGPYVSDTDWMEKHLGVHPRAVINKLRMFRAGNGPALEVFEYVSEDQKKAGPKNSDVGGHHVSFYVKDLEAAVAHLRKHGVRVFGEPSEITEGPSGGLRWIYFQAPWGMTMELATFPNGMGYEKDKKPLWKPAD